MTGDIRSCPVCAEPAGAPFITVLSRPVNCNMLWRTAAEARSSPRGDLEMVFCQGCGHVFNVAFDETKTTYGVSYENSLHHSSVFQMYARTLAERLSVRYDLTGRDLVEIGAGDGEFLQLLCADGRNRGFGFDPSSPRRAPRGGVTLVQEYYDERFRDVPAHLVVCRHVLEHIGASGDFVAMIRRIIGERELGLYIEVPNGLWTVVAGGIWDLIYEHAGYFTPTSLRTVLERNDLEVVEMREEFGGQFLAAHACPGNRWHEAPGLSQAVEDVADAVGRFSAMYHETIERHREWVECLAQSGRDAVIWGAGAKGVSFLNTIGTDGIFSRAVDLNPRKQGMYVAGTGQQIVAPSALQHDPPAVVAVMNPNYRAEIEQALRELNVAAELVMV